VRPWFHSLMTIEPARDDDVGALLPLMRGYCDFYGAAPPDQGLERMARELIAAPDAEGMLIVARGADGELAGFAAVGWKWSSLRGARVAVLEDLFVVPEARGRRTAARLIEACAERVGELGAPCLLWQTAPENQRAQAAYARIGATPETWLEYELELNA
jgi:GNAT superfamily N-acetyltransferase